MKSHTTGFEQGRNYDDEPRLPLDPIRGIDNPGPGEFSWGPGLAPPGLDNAPPREDGRYRGCEATLDHPPDRIITVSRDPRV